jgi:ribonucleotide reductase alpha subunit
LPSFFIDGKIDYVKLHEVTKIVTENLNRIIDVNYYPTEKTKNSNYRHRPIGIGVQGMADLFLKLDLAFTSNEAKEINKNVFETIYHAALEKSWELAVIDGQYETFKGSPTSEGKLQFDLWNIDPTNDRYNWKDLKEKIINDAKNQAKDEVNKIMTEASLAIENQKMAALTDIKNQVGNMVVEISEKVIRKELSAKAEQEIYIRKLADEFTNAKN